MIVSCDGNKWRVKHSCDFFIADECSCTALRIQTVVEKLREVFCRSSQDVRESYAAMRIYYLVYLIVSFLEKFNVVWLQLVIWSRNKCESALQILRAEGLFDCAKAFVLACHDMRLIARVDSQSSSAASSEGSAPPAHFSFCLDSASLQSSTDSSTPGSRCMLFLPNLFSEIMVPAVDSQTKVPPPEKPRPMSSHNNTTSSVPASIGVTGDKGEALVDGNGVEVVDHADDVRLVLQQYDGYLSDLLSWIRWNRWDLLALYGFGRMCFQGMMYMNTYLQQSENISTCPPTSAFLSHILLS